jgi:hypothetical protein
MQHISSISSLSEGGVCIFERVAHSGGEHGANTAVAYTNGSSGGDCDAMRVDSSPRCE